VLVLHLITRQCAVHCAEKANAKDRSPETRQSACERETSKADREKRCERKKRASEGKSRDRVGEEEAWSRRRGRGVGVRTDPGLYSPFCAHSIVHSVPIIFHIFLIFCPFSNSD
jgi:hypothetical protein